MPKDKIVKNLLEKASQEFLDIKKQKEERKMLISKTTRQ